MHGRKYQHIEDLVLFCREEGAHYTDTILNHLYYGYQVEYKWDGGPVIYWGRDKNGAFKMLTKNAWAYLERGTVKTNVLTMSNINPDVPQDVADIVMKTGQPNPDKWRFADALVQLWLDLEECSPDVGFVEGCVLYWPLMPAVKVGDDYHFGTNITKFIANGKYNLAEMVRTTRIGIAATGYYSEIGSKSELRYPHAAALGSDNVMIIPTMHTSLLPGNRHIAKLIKLSSDYMINNEDLISRALDPVPGLMNPQDILYKFHNRFLRGAATLNDFVAWIPENAGPKQLAIIHEKLNCFEAVINYMKLVSDAKHAIMEKLNELSPKALSQINPEGYVFEVKKQFIKLIDQQVWRPRHD